MQRNQAITFDKPLASGDFVIYQRNGVVLRVSKKMLAIAGEYQKIGVEPFRGQLICEADEAGSPSRTTQAMDLVNPAHADDLCGKNTTRIMVTNTGYPAQ
jgi:hypothetical protein